jgi:hypothetical protein
VERICQGKAVLENDSEMFPSQKPSFDQLATYMTIKQRIIWKKENHPLSSTYKTKNSFSKAVSH